MQQVSAWLASPRDHVAIGTETWAVILAGARAVEAQIRARGITVMMTEDAWTFRQTIEKADAQYPNAEAVPSIPPLLNRHVDPITRSFATGEFFGLVGTRPVRPAPVLTAATGARYRGPIRDLLSSQRLWADSAAAHPFKSVSVVGDDRVLDLPEYVAHCGSTWVDIEHRRNGLGGLMARLNVMCAWLKFGAWPIFGTVPPGSNLEKVFGAERVIGTAYVDAAPTTLIYFGTEHLMKESERLLFEALPASRIEAPAA